jgi:threonine aldolase
MLSFGCDYLEGAHEAILEALIKTNREQLSGYGVDSYCTSAKEKIRTVLGMPEADIYFLAGGTQTNATVIAGLLSSYEGVVAAETGHVNVHEAGAIEYTGHKVMTIPQHQGKIQADELEALLKLFWEDPNYEHMVFPGMVYISHPTEYGTLYSKKELEEISAVTRKYKIPLYLDGARLGYGVMSSHTDVTIQDIASLCDAFYIGGTKVGAFCGEAVVFPKNNAPKHFLTIIKQHGAMTAKGRLLGIQFDTLFTDDLYFKIARHAIEMAELLKAEFVKRGYQLYLDSPTNQQFIILDKKEMERLKEKIGFEFWENYDENRAVVRFATSWATTEEMIHQLMEIIDSMDVTIRLAKPEEAETLAVIEARCFPPAEAASREAVLERMEVFPENFLVADLDGTCVGFINGGTTDRPYLPDAFYHDVTLHKKDGDYQTVFGLNVLPEYRRQGIAEKLVKNFLDQAKSRGKLGVILTCKEHMIHYYEKLGFVKYGVSDSEHGGAVWYDMRYIFADK